MCYKPAPATITICLIEHAPDGSTVEVEICMSPETCVFLPSAAAPLPGWHKAANEARFQPPLL